MPSFYGNGHRAFGGGSGVRADAGMPAMSPASRRDSQTLYVGEQLRHMLPRVIGDVRPELIWEQHLSISTEVGPGATHIDWKEMSSFGEMAPMGGGSNDPPRVGAKASRKSQSVAPFHCSFGWNRRELNAALRTGTPLQDILLRTAVRAYRETVERVMIFGWEALDLKGLWNNTSIPKYKLTITFDSNSTPQEIVDALVDFIDEKAELTNGVEGAGDTGGGTGQKLILADNAFRYIRRTKLDATNRISIKQEVEDITGVEILGSPRLNNVATSLSGLSAVHDLMLLIHPDIEKGQGHIPQPFETDPEIQRAGHEWLIYCYAEISGFLAHVPRAFMCGYVARPSS